MFLTTLALLSLARPHRAIKALPPSFQLTIDNIMRGEELVGQEPRGVRWSDDGKTLNFFWKSPTDATGRTYTVHADGTHLAAAPAAEADARTVVPSPNRRLIAYLAGQDVVVKRATGEQRKAYRIDEPKENLTWMADGRHLAFTSQNSERLLALDSGEETDLCTVAPGQGAPPSERPATTQRPSTTGTTGLTTPSQKALAAEQSELFPSSGQQRGFGPGRRFFGGRGGRRGATGATAPANLKLNANQRAVAFQASPDGVHTAVSVFETTGESRATIVPIYITPTGYTDVVNGYPKVGDVHRKSTLAVATKGGGAVWLIPPSAAGKRDYSVSRSEWSADGKTLIAMIDTNDHKDRWLVKVDPTTGASTVLFGDHSDAWLGGPGSYTLGWLPDSRRVYFESEKDGWAHLYTVDVASGEVKQITSGAFEVANVHLSKDGAKFFFESSEGSLFRRHLDSVSVDGGIRTRLLPPDKNQTLAGNTQIYYSPDETHVAYLRSWLNHPPELFVAGLAPGSSETKLTESPSAEWLSYPWSKPELVEIPASDGVKVPAHFYKPAHLRRGGPAVIFVHGAGYLQNVHDWWSQTYYREYMFNHILAAHGVAVLDIDYRASAGYGRDWRTAIYRFMGGRDLDDQVDGAAWLVKEQGVDAKRIGIYGGSYGGFLTLMAMFTKPGVFAAGAALRPVSDWANYNDGYTSDILNLPQDDKEAYRRSSPIFHAEGLQGALLICHGVVDTNVQYQDTVRLVQRLIDLRKENWSVAFFPMESHEFMRASSWADEYKRVFKLFKDNLKF
ncbi:MAG: prolyl oligopeptidase family serine peptidase [Fimbriimonadaceae bacterium]